MASLTNGTPSASVIATAARTLASAAAERAATRPATRAATTVAVVAADDERWAALDYHAWLHGKLDGRRMALDVARIGLGGCSPAARKTGQALERGELRPILVARGRELAEAAAAAGLADGLAEAGDAAWRARYVARYVTVTWAEFACSSEEPEACALQARAEGWLAAPQFGLTGRDWLN